MSNETRDQINALLLARIHALVRFLFPEGKKEGGSWRVSGTLDINLQNGWWGCWNGGTPKISRNLINLWIHATGADFKTAVEDIIRWLGMPNIDQLPPVVRERKPDP